MLSVNVFGTPATVIKVPLCAVDGDASDAVGTVAASGEVEDI